MKVILATLFTIAVFQLSAQTDSTIVRPVPIVDDEKTFTKTEVEAEFPGGIKAWTKHVQTTLAGYSPIDQGAPVGKYQVMLRFIVAKDGTISDLVAETKHGYGMEEQAKKVILTSPNWIPARQNNHIVRAYRRQPITFVVEKQ